VPVALVLRVLLRLAASMLFWRAATSRRTGAPPRRPPVRGRAQARVAAMREGASIAGRVIGLGVAALVTALCLAAGIGPVVLGPRWLGGALLAVALGGLIAAGFEAAALQRLLALRARRRRDRELSEQVYS
jgi:hypothetical protein